MLHIINPKNRSSIQRTSFISNFLTEVTDSDEMYKMLNEFNNEINELKSDYLTGQDQQTDDVIENGSIFYNNQSNIFQK